MRLSIVIPAYNEAAYLPDCLRHVLADIGRCATPDEVEVLVIDNASTDQTATIAASFAGVRVVHEATKGLTSARQAGLAAARGVVLGFVDADTHMPPGWIDEVLATFAADAAVVCVSGPYIYYGATWLERTLVSLFWTVLATPAYWFTGYRAVGGNFAASREALNRIGGFDTAIAFYGEDTDIARRLAKAGKVTFLRGLIMPTSPRRLHAEGWLITGLRYGINFLSEVVLKRPASREYHDIR